jgi:SNF2 family DNA or RNA helicase
MQPEKRLTLRPLQEKHAEQVLREPATLMALPLGSGKTTVAVEAVRRMNNWPYGSFTERVLVVAPRNTRYGWERTFRRQYSVYQSDIDGFDAMFRRIDSSKPGKDAMTALWANQPGWYIVTWEYFTRQPAHFWDKLNVDVVILDEVQRMQNRKSKTWAHMRNVGKKAKRIALSGTFNGNKLEGAWTTLRWLFPEDENSSVYTTPLSFWRWVADWLIAEEDFLGYVSVKGEKYEPGTMLSYYQSYIRDADLEELPGVNEIIVDVPLSGKQKALYRQVEKEALTWLKTTDPNTGRKPMVAELPVTVRMRLRQITLGEPVINDDGKVVYVPDMDSSKIDAALEIVRTELEPMEPVLVFTHSREFAVAAAERFKAEGIPAWAWVGGTTEKQREAALVLWGHPEGIQVIVAVIEAIAEGIDGIQDICNNEIWFSESENMLMNTQAKKRADRFGQKKVVNRWRLIAPGTYDEGILNDHIIRQLELNASLRGK